MDEFLKEIYVTLFKKWILLQKSDRYSLYADKTDENTIIIETDVVVGKIIFNPYHIIEMIIYNKQLKDNDFYLHFQMKTLHHAIGLFNEMIETIYQYIDKPKTKILLCCSGGMTTSYFASKMNKAFQILNLSMEVEATAYHYLYQNAQDYDMILLAPQVSYYYNEVKRVFETKQVLKIPPQVFGKYDVGKMLSLIQQSLKNKQHYVKQAKTLPALKTHFHHHQSILSLSIYKNFGKNYISYNVYNQYQDIILHHDIVKNTLHIEDIYDVLNTVFIQYPQINVIGISVPTVTNNGYLEESIIDDLKDNNLYEALLSHYDKKFYISNDANNAALGYYATQKKYSSIVFIFQPIQYPGGAGMIIDGKLLEGSCHLAGEIKYIPLNLSKDLIELTMTPFGTVELVSKTILSIISVMNPEIIVIKSDLILDVQDLRVEIKKYLPEEYIPPICKITDLQEYILLGNMVWCSQILEQ